MAERGFALLLLPAIAWLVLFLVAPLAALLIGSFTSDHGGFTFAHYSSFLADPFYLGVLGRTFLWSCIVTLACLALGFPLAMVLQRLSGWARAALILVLLAPLLISVVVRNYGWLILLGPRGLIAGAIAGLGLDPPRMSFTPFAVMLGLVHSSLPYMVMATLGSLERIDPAALRAAEGLGAGQLRIFCRVIAPLSLPGIVAGSCIVFSLAAASFVTPEILGGGKVKFAGSFVYERVISLLDYSSGSALGFILSAATLLLLGSYSRLLLRSAIR